MLVAILIVLFAAPKARFEEIPVPPNVQELKSTQGFKDYKPNL